MNDHRIICGESKKAFCKLKLPYAKCIFADPPDNINLKYDNYTDKIDNYGVATWAWISTFSRADIIWWSVNYQHEMLFGRHISELIKTGQGFGDAKIRKIIWNFDFGQYRTKDLSNDFRPIFRIIKSKKVKIYPEHILVPSARQLKYNDKRAVSKGRVPSDVWKFPRVAGTHAECRKWHPTQHPEALIERIIKFSTQKGDLVIDPFGGSGTTLRVCQKLDRKCITIECSEKYCENIGAETGVKIEYCKG